MRANNIANLLNIVQKKLCNHKWVIRTYERQLSGEGRSRAEGRGAGRLRAARRRREVRRVLRATHTRDPRGGLGHTYTIVPNIRLHIKLQLGPDVS